MPFPNPTACNVALTQIAGTGFNTVAVPVAQGAEYKAISEQLLYEIWQGILQLIAATNPPGMVTPILFTIGDGKSGTPTVGSTAFHVAALADKEALVLRNGIQLQFSDGVTALQIIRFNDGTDGGFDFDPASGLSFQNGDSFQIFPLGANTSF